MLVDQHVFCGSLNVADPYSGTRYGDSSFRDLNIILRNQDAREVRSFFLDLLLQNEKHFKDQINRENLIKDFERLDMKYGSLEKMD